MADWTQDLTGPQRDAAAALVDLFTRYGLASLAPKVIDFVRQGYSSDTISLLLQDTAEYKQRFAANAERQKKGLPVLTPAEYISAEQSYRSIMAGAGLPVGFYDQQSDFQRFIANDVSPTELKSRVDLAANAIRRAPAETKTIFSQWYTDGDMIAYALDPTKAAPLVEQRIQAAEAAALAKSQGSSLDQSTAEYIGNQGASFDQLQQGVGFIAQESKTTSKLDAIYGGDVTSADIAREVFGNDAQAATKRGKLASQERAAFSGSSGSRVAFGSDSGQI